MAWQIKTHRIPASIIYIRMRACERECSFSLSLPSKRHKSGAIFTVWLWFVCCEGKKLRSKNSISFAFFSLSLSLFALFRIAEQIRKRAYKIKSESSKCCLWWFWSFLFAGRRYTLSTRLPYSIHKLSIKHLATPPSLIFNYWHIHRAAVIQSPTALWTEASAKLAWIYFVASDTSTKRDASASVAQSVLHKAVRSHS